MENYYQILGVSHTASQQDIRKRFRFLAQAFHPDKFAGSESRAEAEEAFKIINNAYQILSDTVKQAEYDKELSVQVMLEEARQKKEEAEARRRRVENEQRRKEQTEFDKRQAEEEKRQRVQTHSLDEQIEQALAERRRIIHSFNRTCQNCGGLAQRDNLFCNKCGVRLNRICHKCGVSILQTDKLCWKCGAILDGKERQS